MEDPKSDKAWIATTADFTSSELLATSAHPLAISQTSACPPAAPGRHASWSQRLAVHQITTLPWSLQEDLDEYRRNHVAGVGLYWRKLQEAGLRKAMRKIQESGVPVSSLGWIGGFTGEHGHSLNESLKEARRVIRTAGQLRASAVTIVTGPLAGHIRSHALRLVCAALRELVQLAATYQVQLVLQPMHSCFAKSWSFINTLDDAFEVLERVGDPRLKLAFSPYHLCDEVGLLELIPSLTSRVGLVSLADCVDSPRHENDRLLPGEGQIPLADVVHAFENSGYSGWYELEVWSRDLWKLAPRDLMRRCLDARHVLSAKVAASEKAEGRD
ncbi:sugar phosphate isomerase/epimerase family protein [Planctomicrobium sp. SH664]|uniref:sugar phosphate isomerase/epimerase family protein n=1 Tax=Planctomicrobium sp. SH664 TaxID=3448125 RepID=UPI003F5C58E2